MSFRALAALALLIFAMAMERCGYYAVRSFLLIDLVRVQYMPHTSAMLVYRAVTVVSIVGTFAGGGLAWFIGPRITAIIGAGIAAVGAFAIAAGAPLSMAVFVVALGSAMFKPCPYAAAAQIFADEDGGAAQGFAPSARRFASYATFAMLTYGAINLGAMIAPAIAGLLHDSPTHGTAYGFAGAFDLLAGVLAGIAMFLGTAAAKKVAAQAHAPYRAPDAAPPAAPAPGATSTPNEVWGPLTQIGLLVACAEIVMSHAFPNAIELGLPRASWLYSVNPVVVLLMIVPCAVGYLVLAVQRSSVPLMKFLGAGLLVFAVGGVLGLLALFTHAGAGLWALALGTMAIGEAVAFPLGLVYAALVARGRSSTMVVAGWLALTSMPATMLDTMFSAERHPFIPMMFSALAVITVVVGGVLVVVHAARMHRVLGGAAQ